MGLLAYCLGKELIFVKNSNPPIKVGMIHTSTAILEGVFGKTIQNQMF